MARLILRLAPWLSVLAVAAAWELFARSGAVTPFMLPKLTTVLSATLCVGLLFLAGYSGLRIQHMAERLRERYASFRAVVRELD